MYRVVLTDVRYVMGFSPMPDVVLFETEDEKLALLKLSECEKKNECSGRDPNTWRFYLNYQRGEK